jgi:polysaccharide export outer membrane protein
MYMKKLLLPPVMLRLVTLLVLGLLSSCTQNLFMTKKPLAAPATLAVGTDYQYHLRKDDKLSISVFDHEELSIGSIYGHYSVNENEGKWVLVDASGNMNVPKVGSYHVEGLTVSEAEDQLEKLMAKWIVNPQITIKVLNLQATVLGEVNTPGNQRFDKERNTLIEVLGKAGDFGVYADKRHVKVMRQDAKGTYATEINLMKMSGFEHNNLIILPGDVVYVPSKNGKQFDRKSPSILGVASIISTFFIVFRFLQQ